MALNETEFYGRDTSAKYSEYYAQSRYLCYYLQEKGLLVKYYQEFSAGAKEDPTGFKSLKKVLGEKDMAVFQKRWQEWVLTLRFP
jgi:hypothetical protein